MPAVQSIQMLDRRFTRAVGTVLDRREVLQSCTAADDEALEPVALSAPTDDHEAELADEPAARQPGQPSCRTCGVAAFATADEQRAHFKSDWHRCNVKRRLVRPNAPPLSEPQFLQLVEEERLDDEVGSISGGSDDSSDDEGEARRAGAGQRGRGPNVVFSAPDGKSYALWRCILADPEAAGADALRAACALCDSGGRWALVMLRGGHFTAAEFQLQPPAKPGKPATISPLGHKSLHRYVVRAKAGGKQSGKDATGKFARSAGARLRRYNEAALQRDIEELLRGEWAAPLAAASLVLVAAPGANWRQLCGGEQPLLDPADPRLRRIPFVTRRPTLSEAQRALRTLLTLYEVAAPEPQPAAAAAADAAEAPAPAAQPSASSKASAAPAGPGSESGSEGEPKGEAGGMAAGTTGGSRSAASKRKERRARQARQAKQGGGAGGTAAAASAAAVPEPAPTEEEVEAEISAVAARVAALQARTQKRAAAQRAAQGPSRGGGVSRASAPAVAATRPPPANETAAARRQRLAAAAEARAAALQAAAQQQKLY